MTVADVQTGPEAPVEQVDQPEAPPSVLVTNAAVHRVQRLSPAFVRITLTSPDFADLGSEGRDTRFKVVLPGPTGELPAIPERPEDYYAAWLGMPDELRAPMRTYTIRDIVTEGDRRLLVVDFVVHEPLDEAGPACRWAMTARPGDVVQVITPHRAGIEAGVEYGGTEFCPGAAREVLIAGDETTVPAVSRILLDLDPGVRAEVFLEVPSADDVLALDVPEGSRVHWLPRDGAAYGRRLVAAVRRHLGLPYVEADAIPVPELKSDLDIDVWETPRYSASGEDLDAQLGRRTHGSDLADVYAWIAGESWAVKALRRSLVSELDVDRCQVAFMGYWREGVAMKS